MKNKSYDYIFGNGKFNTWFNIIVSIISCSAISFCLTELLFSFDFKVSFQKALIFTILFVIFLLLFYYFIKQRTYKLFDQKITYGFRERKILYADIHSLVFTLSSRPKGIYDIGLGEPYLYINLAYPSVIQKRYDINISNGQIGMSPAYSFNCYDIKSIFNLIHHSKANIYVTKSFLLFNNWTINRFCKEYNISMEMVQLINDGN